MAFALSSDLVVSSVEIRSFISPFKVQNYALKSGKARHNLGVFFHNALQCEEYFDMVSQVYFLYVRANKQCMHCGVAKSVRSEKTAASQHLFPWLFTLRSWHLYLPGLNHHLKFLASKAGYGVMGYGS